jgi:N-acetyl-anhydromuramyl-L-alanine amidase AmpD
MARSIVVLAMALGCALFWSAPALADPPPYYPDTDWIPAAAGNYQVGRAGASIQMIVIHETDGTYFSAINWFRNPRSRSSAHYLVRAWDGKIAQFVAESDMAYHAKIANPFTIGIEHEYDPRHGIGHTAVQYESSASLVCAIARRYGIPIDREHIVGHNELRGNDHRDPGPTWNWTYYMSLVRSCAHQQDEAPKEPVALSTYPLADLKAGDESPDVALLQWDLVYLGFMAGEDIAGGAGTFGPATQTAVGAFQHLNGLPSTGLYDAPTAAALARSFVADPPDTPIWQLEPGAESDDVTRLQTGLEALGYMDLITGYYGPVTYEAVGRFQADNGIESTGTYGSLTRMALAFRAREVSSVGTVLATAP